MSSTSPNHEHNHGHAIVTQLTAAARHAHGCQSSHHAYTGLLMQAHDRAGSDELHLLCHQCSLRTKLDAARRM